MTLVQQLESWIQDKENERLEFKRAENNYDFDKLIKYCVALANEGGGKLILGVTDKYPRQILGTQAFQNLEGKKHELERQDQHAGIQLKRNKNAIKTQFSDIVARNALLDAL